MRFQKNACSIKSVVILLFWRYLQPQFGDQIKIHHNRQILPTLAVFNSYDRLPHLVWAGGLKSVQQVVCPLLTMFCALVVTLYAMRWQLQAQAFHQFVITAMAKYSKPVLRSFLPSRRLPKLSRLASKKWPLALTIGKFKCLCTNKYRGTFSPSIKSNLLTRITLHDISQTGYCLPKTCINWILYFHFLWQKRWSLF